jgi:hypothetical protein
LGFINAINLADNSIFGSKMRNRLSATLMTLVVLVVLSHLPQNCLCDSSFSYQLLNRPDGSTYYRLNVVVSQSLYEYYLGRSHTQDSNLDFAKFVTPYSLKPVADRLLEVYADDEDFANGVLMIVHQIPYEVTIPEKYPVETIVENKGDCDLLSFIAASIIKAGGVDVVLFYYESQAHMNIGIRLQHEPNEARQTAHYVTYNGARYYMAECTGGNWQNGWRVGECPHDLEQATMQVVSLDGYEQWAPGQVSASYHNLASSTLSIMVSPTTLTQGSPVTISGRLYPSLQNKTVTIYESANNSPWIIIGTTTTDSNGHYAYTWNAQDVGIVSIRTGWSGDDYYSGTDSPSQTATVLSTFFIVLLAITVVLVSVGLVAFLMSRRAPQEIQAPQPPEIPAQMTAIGRVQIYKGQALKCTKRFFAHT